MGRIFDADRPIRGPRRVRRRLSDGEKAMCVLIIGVFFLWLPNSALVNERLPRLWQSLGASSQGGHDAASVPAQHPIAKARDTGDDIKVPFEAHIMSKCPDAQYCLQELVVPAMEDISDKVDFRLSFIGNYSDTSDEVECKHGPSECIGNSLMLCAANLPANDDYDMMDEEEQALRDEASWSSLYPKISVVRSLGFANCLSESYEDIPQESLVKGCAMEHGISFKELNTCASRQIDDPDEPDDDPSKVSGLALLRKSFQRSQELGVTTSCTIRVDEQEWCVRDGGRWRNCGKRRKNARVGSLVEHISKLYEERNWDGNEH
ncbi:hypothetical protein KEM55_009227 [Ascosphaera atra]|nr:hypothetical protein KEM55_009227 [Ascosphaera atra]